MILVTVLVLAGLTVADWYVRNSELQRLMTATEAAADAIGQWETARRGIVASLPSAHFVTPEVRRRSERRVQRQAEAAATALSDAIAGVERVTVSVPWHGGIIRARDRYLAHADAWIDRLQRLARDPAALTQPAPAITATRTASAQAFRAALPVAALHGLGDRIDAVFPE